jgi:ABC-type dipeptide/oligopeptide/nickel transport system permease subunit
MSLQMLPLEEDVVAASVAHPPSRSIFWLRFRSHPAVFFAMAVLAGFVLMAIFAPQITPGVTPDTSYALRLRGIYVPHGPSLQDFPALIFGNNAYDDFDGSRRSVLTEVTFGGRVSLTVSFLAATFATLIGAILGALSGYLRGWVDDMLMRMTDILLAIPFLPLVAAVVILSPVNLNSLQAIIILFTVLGWPPIARLVRGNVLLLAEQDFIEAARAQGVSTWRILVRQLLPNVLPFIIISFTSTITLFLIADATLDFLSLGVITQMSWGGAFRTAFADVLTFSWWAIVFPGLCIVLTVFSVNTIGEALRDAFDVRGRVA